ncbi:M24 family metallopeptidase [Streptomyces sp. NPDC057257]|uniref:M24 family metallopeptidase n=1 Tax=Streptomyces sp. NPDC057257 TaxID=3346071 RepID=UPI00363F3222
MSQRYEVDGADTPLQVLTPNDDPDEHDLELNDGNYALTAGKIASAAVADGLAPPSSTSPPRSPEPRPRTVTTPSWAASAARSAPAGALCNCTASRPDAPLSEETASGWNSPAPYHQYWAKQMRSGVLGRADDELRRAYDIVVGAQDAALAEMGPGVPASRIAELCRRPVLDAGLVERYENRVG